MNLRTQMLLVTLLGGLLSNLAWAQEAPTAPVTPQTVPTQIPAGQPEVAPHTLPADNLLQPAGGEIVQASVKQGWLAGRKVNGINRFLGVPYAAPPLKALRWQPPQPAPAWIGRQDASRFSNICVQRPNAITGNPDRTLSGSEDCLYLNIYAPTNTQNAPVMVWVHGGSFDTGTGNIYDASKLAERGVVVVTLNYRLGPLGFLAAPVLGSSGTGNYGLMDVQAALAWVKTNAAAFGGNPENVTAFGESAGGMVLCNLMTSLRSKGLFQKAILQSGPCNVDINTIALSQALDIGARYTRDLNCPPTPEGAECLRGKTPSELFDITVPGSRAPNSVALPPVYGDAVVPVEPYQAYQTGMFTTVPVLLGSNRNEGSIFTAYVFGDNLALSKPLYLGLLTVLNPSQALTLLRQYPPEAFATAGLSASAVITDGLFACPVYNVAQQLARFVPTYAYEFSDPQAVTELSATDSVPALGAYHASELIYVFGTALEGLADPINFTSAQRRLSEQMQQYWVNFATTGNPNTLAPSATLAPWPAMTPQQPAVLILKPQTEQASTKLEISTDFAARHRCAFWDSLAGK